MYFFLGLLILLSLLSTIVGFVFIEEFYMLAGACAWVAAVVLFPAIQKKTILITLSLLSVVAIGFNYISGIEMDYLKLFTVNQNLIALLIAVSLLRLITTAKIDSDDTSPSGKKSFIKTYLSVHIFGSIINLSALLLIADKMYQRAALTKLQLISLTRAFGSDAYWSPFFVAFAAASIYAPKLNSLTVLVSGLLLAAIGFLVTYMEVRKSNLEDFYGFPLNFRSLVLPSTLACMVLVTHYFFPHFKVILLVILFSTVLVFFTLPFKLGLLSAIDKFKGFIEKDLTNMKTEISLFLIAGVFGISISSLLIGLEIHLPFENFNWMSASVLLVTFVGLSFIGIHPIVSIAMIGGYVENVDHTLLAVSFLMSWASTVATSPFSGLNITMQGRYNINAIEIFKYNIAFTGKMFLVYIPVLYILDNYWGV